MGGRCLPLTPAGPTLPAAALSPGPYIEGQVPALLVTCSETSCHFGSPDSDFCHLHEEHINAEPGSP